MTIIQYVSFMIILLGHPHVHVTIGHPHVHVTIGHPHVTMGHPHVTIILCYGLCMHARDVTDPVKVTRAEPGPS